MGVYEAIETLFEQNGSDAYFGEDVTISEHMLLTAEAARADGAAPHVIVASLMHDIGHLLHDLGEDCADRGIDSCHESRGAEWLASRFGANVVDPVRLHVAAKRYLCTVTDYVDCLTPASVESFYLQGGRMTSEEIHEFERQPNYQDAVLVRKYDDLGKDVTATVPPLASFQGLLDEQAVAVAR